MKNLLLFLTLLSLPSYGQSVRGAILKGINNDKASIYINSIWNDAKEVCDSLNLPMAVLIAQACHESNYGRSRIAKELNNHLGIKPQNEYIKFKSVKSCFYCWARTLTKYPCYTTKRPKNILSWANRLEACKWATKGYSGHIKKLMEQYKLYLIP